MSIDIKSLGIISRYNGLDINQTRNYIKIYNKSYIDKILKVKGWIDAQISDNHNRPIPMHDDAE